VSKTRSINLAHSLFTTLGYGDITINSANRMLAGFEAMNGVLLLGWTTAMMFSLLQLTVKDLLKKVSNE